VRGNQQQKKKQQQIPDGITNKGTANTNQQQLKF
jgi:hypothetical protein